MQNAKAWKKLTPKRKSHENGADGENRKKINVFVSITVKIMTKKYSYVSVKEYLCLENNIFLAIK